MNSSNTPWRKLFALDIAALLFLLMALTLPQAKAITLKPCHLPGMTDAVLCGTLPRPLDPAAPVGGRQINIAFAVIPSKAREKHPDQVYFLAGGPGQSAMDLIPGVEGLLSRLNNRRDLVFVDQRGTGKSAPLHCEPETQLSLAKAMDPLQLPRRMEACRTQLEKLPHGDLRFYSTTIAMTDLNAVRTALGHDRINLVGASYGTRAALEYLRLYPQQVRRVVLDGVAPASISLTQTMSEDAHTAMQSLLDDCAKDTHCTQRYPQLQTHWNKLFASLPKTISVNNPLTGQPEQVQLTANMVASMVRGTLYVPRLSSGLPYAITEAAQDRWTALVGLSSTTLSRTGGGMAMGMHFSVICAEDPLRTSSSATAGHFAGLMDSSYKTICANWPKSQIDASFYDMPASAAPLLMFSGGVDPATPPRHGQEVAKALGEAQVRHIQVAKAGHGLLQLGCTRDIVFKFLDHKVDAQALQVDAACLNHIPRPSAFVPLRSSLETRP
jgi:pimeloyl-ACP methyl ester carboxylesterase